MGVAINVFDDTDFLLQQWARWAWRHKLGGYPSMTPFRRMAGGIVSSPMITDNVALQVDQAIAQLKKREPDIGRVVSRYYLHGGNMSEVLRRSKVSRRVAMQLLNAGIAWIDATLEIDYAVGTTA